MARTGRPVAEVTLTDQERQTLVRWSRRAKSSQALAQRCRIVLGCADGKSNQQVAAELGIWPQTVGKWRRRFLGKRLDGLADQPRPGAPRKITDEQVERVLAATREQAPVGSSHWSRASMAAESGLSKSAVGRIWKEFGIKPHLAGTFAISNDPQFVEKVRDLVGLHLDPPEKALVLTVDEKSQIQSLDRSAPVHSTVPGPPERRTHVRPPITTLFAALEAATGEKIGSIHRRDRAVELTRFLAKLDTQVPADLGVHLICDDYGTHKAPAVTAWLSAHPRFQLHFAPTYSSWLNEVERWFGLLTEKQPRAARTSLHALERDLREWTTAGKDNPRSLAWSKSADEILERLATYLQRIPGAAR